MKKQFWQPFISLFTIFVLAGCAAESPSISAEQIQMVKDPVIGFGVSPKHTPRHTIEDLNQFFDLAAKKGGWVTFISQLSDPAPLPVVTLLIKMAHERGLKFYLQLSPTKVDTKRDSADLPANLKGKGFTDAAVRTAYRQKCLEYAATKPDLFSLGTEINFLSANSKEMDAFVSLYKECHEQLKKAQPQLPLTISFQYDLLKTKNDWAVIDRFQPMDVVSFTSYPCFSVQDVAALPLNYYDDARTHLPVQTSMVFSELGWSSDIGGEAMQAKFCRLLPDLFRKSQPQVICHILMYDVNILPGPLAVLNHCGYISNDGKAKPAWSVVAKEQIR